MRGVKVEDCEALIHTAFGLNAIHTGKNLSLFPELLSYSLSSLPHNSSCLSLYQCVLFACSPLDSGLFTDSYRKQTLRVALQGGTFVGKVQC